MRGNIIIKVYGLLKNVGCVSNNGKLLAVFQERARRQQT